MQHVTLLSRVRPLVTTNAAAVTTTMAPIKATMRRAVVVAMAVMAVRIASNKCAGAAIRRAATSSPGIRASRDYHHECDQDRHCQPSNQHGTTSVIR